MEIIYDKDNDFWWKVEPFDNAGTPDICYSIYDRQDCNGNAMSFSLNNEGGIALCNLKWADWRNSGFHIPTTENKSTTALEDYEKAVRNLADKNDKLEFPN